MDLFEYDYFSIMHYPPTAFSLDGAPTIVPVPSAYSAAIAGLAGRELSIAYMGQRVGLSSHDLRVFNWAYAACVDDINPGSPRNFVCPAVVGRTALRFSLCVCVFVIVCVCVCVCVYSVCDAHLLSNIHARSTCTQRRARRSSSGA